MVWFYLYKILENGNYSIVIENSSVTSWDLSAIGVWGRVYKGHKETSGSDGDLHYHNYGDDFVGVYKCQRLLNCAF